MGAYKGLYNKEKKKTETLKQEIKILESKNRYCELENKLKNISRIPFSSINLSKGLIKKESLEHLELEDLQGITGLKALRVEVNYESELGDAGVSIDKLLEGIGGN